jgi:hypothetical protein
MQFSDEDLRRINEIAVQQGKEMLIEAFLSQRDDDDNSGRDDLGRDDFGGVDSGGVDLGVCDQLMLDSLIKPIEWPEGRNWGTFSIDASSTPVDIIYPTNLKLLNEARQSPLRE